MRGTEGVCLALLGLLLSGCGGGSDNPVARQEGRPALPGGMTTADRLDALAAETGALSVGSATSPVGAYARNYESGRDRFCVAPKGQTGHYTFGAELSIGTIAHCHLHGEAQDLGDRLLLVSSDDRCRVDARYDGDQIVLPGALPPSCARACTGRGNLAGVSFPRAGEGAAAALALTARDGRPLCAE